MSEGKHTPTPWVQHSYTIRGPSGRVIANTTAQTSIPETTEGFRNQKAINTANSRFIVKAVNSHDQLVEALKFYKESVRYEYDNTCCWNPPHGTMTKLKRFGMKSGGVLEDDGETARAALIAAGEEV